jgi:hypothetical protein
MNDPNLVAVAVAAWALVWMMQRLSDGRAVEPAILLMAVAGFYKHNVAAIPLTALIWLGLVDRRLALRAAVVGAAAVLLGLAICGLIWGDAFFTQLFTPRNYSFGYLWRDFDRLRWIAPALVIFVVWVRHDWQHAASRFAALFVTIAFVLQCVTRRGGRRQFPVRARDRFRCRPRLGIRSDRSLAGSKEVGRRSQPTHNRCCTDRAAPSFHSYGALPCHC